MAIGIAKEYNSAIAEEHVQVPDSVLRDFYRVEGVTAVDHELPFNFNVFFEHQGTFSVRFFTIAWPLFISLIALSRLLAVLAPDLHIAIRPFLSYTLLFFLAAGGIFAVRVAAGQKFWSKKTEQYIKDGWLVHKTEEKFERGSLVGIFCCSNLKGLIFREKYIAVIGDVVKVGDRPDSIGWDFGDVLIVPRNFEGVEHIMALCEETCEEDEARNGDCWVV
jgi:hypothetical protein